MRLVRKELIAQRRAQILILSSKGLPQEEIADKLKVDLVHISQKTVSHDSEWLKKMLSSLSKNTQQEDEGPREWASLASQNRSSNHHE